MRGIHRRCAPYRFVPRRPHGIRPVLKLKFPNRSIQGSLLSKLKLLNGFIVKGLFKKKHRFFKRRRFKKRPAARYYKAALKKNAALEALEKSAF